MNEGASHLPKQLELRADRQWTGITIVVLIALLVVLPAIGWTQFGPSAVGEIEANGNSILAFWIARVALAAFFVGVAIALRRYWDLWRNSPLLFVLKEKGLTDEAGRFRAWDSFETAYVRNGTLYLVASDRIDGPTLTIEPNQVGYASTDQAIEFLRRHAPPSLAAKL